MQTAQPPRTSDDLRDANSVAGSIRPGPTLTGDGFLWSVASSRPDPVLAAVSGSIAGSLSGGWKGPCPPSPGQGT